VKLGDSFCGRLRFFNHYFLDSAANELLRLLFSVCVASNFYNATFSELSYAMNVHIMIIEPLVPIVLLHLLEFNGR